MSSLPPCLTGRWTIHVYRRSPGSNVSPVEFNVLSRCRDCSAVLEEYDEETLSLAVVVLSMFIHLSPDLAAPMLLDIMQSVGRYYINLHPHSTSPINEVS